MRSSQDADLWYAGFKENSHSRSTSPPCQVDILFEFTWLLLIAAAPRGTKLFAFCWNSCSDMLSTSQHEVCRMPMRKRSSSWCLRDRKSFPAANFLFEPRWGRRRKWEKASGEKSLSLEHLPATQLVNQLVLSKIFHKPSGFVGLLNCQRVCCWQSVPAGSLQALSYLQEMKDYDFQPGVRWPHATWESQGGFWTKVRALSSKKQGT